MERSTIKETTTKTVNTIATDQVGDNAKDLSFESASLPFSSPSPISFSSHKQNKFLSTQIQTVICTTQKKVLKFEKTQ